MIPRTPLPLGSTKIGRSRFDNRTRPRPTTFLAAIASRGPFGSRAKRVKLSKSHLLQGRGTELGRSRALADACNPIRGDPQLALPPKSLFDARIAALHGRSRACGR